MSRSQRAGVAMYLFLIGTLCLTKSDANLLELFLYLALFLVAHAMITWDNEPIKKGYKDDNR